MPLTEAEIELTQTRMTASFPRYPGHTFDTAITWHPYHGQRATVI
jgi:hypothetical protein